MANTFPIDTPGLLSPPTAQPPSRWLADLARTARGLVGHCHRSVQRLRQRRAVFSDRESIRTYRELVAGRVEPTAEAAILRIRPIGDREVHCRPGTSDVHALWDCFLKGHHLPPREAGAVRTILDLGANVGYAMVHFAAVYPEARILGVDLDAGNVALCQRNIAPFGDRHAVLHGAAWTEDGQIAYGGDSEWGFRVLPESGPVRDRVRAFSLSTLLDQLGPCVDYVKMDVEGAEFDLLTDCRAWIHRVRWMKVEVHRPRTTAEMIALLRNQGIHATQDPGYADCVIARGSSEPAHPTSR